MSPLQTTALLQSDAQLKLVLKLSASRCLRYADCSAWKSDEEVRKRKQEEARCANYYCGKSRLSNDFLVLVPLFGREWKAARAKVCLCLWNPFFFSFGESEATSYMEARSEESESQPVCDMRKSRRRGGKECAVEA